MSVSEIRLAAMNYLARREHSVFELKNKLLKKFSNQDCSEQALSLHEQLELVISQLIKDNLLSDEHFAELFIKMRISKGFGPLKIAHELTLKEVNQEIIENGLAYEPEIWLEHLERLRIKKFGESIPVDIKEKSRQYRYLYQRGYNAEQIKMVLN